jgi:pyridoxine 5-phosphate synthase
VSQAVETLREAGIRTSLFVAADPAVLDAAHDMSADAVELHTGGFAEAWKMTGRQRAEAVREELARLDRAAAHGRALDLDVHAGHGLTYENVADVARIAAIEELNIGHSVISRAVLIGMERAVREMKTCLLRARGIAPESLS